MDPSGLNLIDVAAAFLLVAGVIGGVRSGALPQLGGLVGAVAGAALLLAAAPLFRQAIEGFDGAFRTVVIFAGLIAGVGSGEILGSATGRAISSALGDGVLGILDRAFGAVVGVGQAVLIVWLVGGLVALGPGDTLAGQAQRSFAVRTTTAALPPISEVASDVGGLIDASGLPQVFIGLEPVPAAPVATPASPEAERIAAGAKRSTVEVLSTACAFELTGTGFAVAPTYVVTNAHVVAGASETRIRVNGRTRPADVVLFDPGLDVALLHVEGLSLPPLTLAASAPGRGTRGAALGHPGGAPLTVIPAAVSASYQAEGRDLYGKRTVTRDILELRAAIDRGDSGGPFILADGTVGGLVFAEARSDPGIGYALDPAAVAAAIARALESSTPADTGPCLR